MIHTFTDLADYSVKMCDTDHSCATVTLICRYIRREIRSLLQVDREAFLDAMRVMMDVSTAQGKQLFGPDYRDFNHFVRQHHILTAPRSGDQLHDGVGFLTNHVVHSNGFERVLQTVEPRMALPYWDFTMDAAVVDSGDELSYSRSFWELSSQLWSDSWFGSAENEAHTVREGRWAQLQTPMIQDLEELQSPFGYMRAPWNFNRNPFMTRNHQLCGVSAFEALKSGFITHPWPSCADHWAAALSTNFSRWQDFAWSLLLLVDLTNSF